MVKISLNVNFDKNSVEFKGTPDEIIENIKNKIDELSKKGKGEIWLKVVKLNMDEKLPNWCKKLLQDKNVYSNEDLVAIFVKAYSESDNFESKNLLKNSCPTNKFIEISSIKWDDGTITTEEDLKRLKTQE